MGGEAGAEGRRGLGTFCGIVGGIPVLGVGGGLGCECLIESLRLGGCWAVTAEYGVERYACSWEPIAGERI